MVETFLEPLGENDFKAQLLRLRQRDQSSWAVLVGQLRRVTLPWIVKKVGALPSYALLSQQEFALEIFADSLSKYYDLFENGSFTKPEELQSLMFKVAEFKIKEALRRLSKEALIYRPQGDEDFEKALHKTPDWTQEDDQTRDRAKSLQRHLDTLKPDERLLLQRFYAGEKMSQIAQEMNTSEENLRKRKQRALDRLKQLFGAITSMIWMILNP